MRTIDRETRSIVRCICTTACSAPAREGARQPERSTNTDAPFGEHGQPFDKCERRKVRLTCCLAAHAGNAAGSRHRRYGRQRRRRPVHVTRAANTWPRRQRAHRAARRDDRDAGRTARVDPRRRCVRVVSAVRGPGERRRHGPAMVTATRNFAAGDVSRRGHDSAMTSR